ncbi:MAG: hypothetical protein RIG82_09690 [Phycisphaeraceae bacterium]
MMKLMGAIALTGVVGLAAVSAQAGSVVSLPLTGLADLTDNNDGTGTTTGDGDLLVFEEYSNLTLGDVLSFVGGSSGYEEVVPGVSNDTGVSIFYLHYDPDHKTGGNLNLTFDLGAEVLGFIGVDGLMNSFDGFMSSMPTGAVHLPGATATSVLYPTGRSARGAGPGGGGGRDLTTIFGSEVTASWHVPKKAVMDTARLVVRNEVAPPPTVIPSPAAAGAGCVLLGLLAARRSRL